ncbi:MAG: hypothetical protein ACP5OA_03760 [Candidatus Woesearchaeota archaeon]
MLKYKNRSRIKAQNCMGTVLYYLGFIEKERDAYDEEVWTHINPYDSKTTPSLEYRIAVWFNKEYFLYNKKYDAEIKAIDHIGIITDLNPLQMTHRKSFGGPFIENQSIKEIIPEYGELIFFYHPEKE